MEDWEGMSEQERKAALRLDFEQMLIAMRGRCLICNAPMAEGGYCEREKAMMEENG